MWISFSRGWKKLPIPIKAVIIAGVFTLVASIIGGLIDLAVSFVDGNKNAPDIAATAVAAQSQVLSLEIRLTEVKIEQDAAISAATGEALRDRQSTLEAERQGLLATLASMQTVTKETVTNQAPPATLAPTAEQTPTALPPIIIATDGATMALIFEGPFEMGYPSGANDEKPVHTVIMDDFYIDQYEVANSQFSDFLNAVGNKTENGVSWFDAPDPSVRIHQIDGVWIPDDGYARHPVIEVTWHGANEYCSWRGDRLPTEAEWEKAARGIDGRVYPWGNTFEGNRLNFCDRNCLEKWANAQFDDGYGGTAPVGSYPDNVSPYGVYDMVGNVLEWVTDWYSEDYYDVSPQTNPTGPESGNTRVLRGGSWYAYRRLTNSTVRVKYDPTVSYGFIGFRCARSP